MICRHDIEIARFGIILERGEPSFAELLMAAGFVQVNHQVGPLGGEVGGGVVECEVTVFADPDKGHVNWIGPESVSKGGRIQPRDPIRHQRN